MTCVMLALFFHPKKKKKRKRLVGEDVVSSRNIPNSWDHRQCICTLQSDAQMIKWSEVERPLSLHLHQ
ncbi:hypothetical protein MUK42_33647 [Musa troglodytarum]|uniref:Uncharacterized protein n=1 Tax=Musa troglodytarum TaxID=320322 RepID=A0A9E7KM22_9LILI|nr:hypothetical protein MUK42_34667 [Musa troglodytarum]URE23947.1 hypothetical protein MUK42_33647 [Musa troglodytarum]